MKRHSISHQHFCSDGEIFSSFFYCYDYDVKEMNSLECDVCDVMHHSIQKMNQPISTHTPILLLLLLYPPLIVFFSISIICYIQSLSSIIPSFPFSFLRFLSITERKCFRSHTNIAQILPSYLLQWFHSHPLHPDLVVLYK